MLRLNHKKLEVWKLGIEFVSDIYRQTEGFPKKELYGITNQLRRAAVSIPSNIAEGASRSSKPERKRFYEIARSSVVEIDTQLEVAKALGYLTEDDLKDTARKINSLFALLSKLIERMQG